MKATVQALEAVCRGGRIVPLEPVQFEENEHLVIVRMPASPTATAAPQLSVADWESLAGALKDTPNWNGDPVGLQEAPRREWD